jgi:hypothetical protein
VSGHKFSLCMSVGSSRHVCHSECPGTYLAEASLWIQIASILSVFRLSTPKDQDGHHIDVSYAREPPPDLVL